MPESSAEGMSAAAPPEARSPAPAHAKQKAPTARKQGFVSRFNDLLATKITLMVGTMWAFYAFVIFGLTPLIWPQHETQILYWSNFLQLIFLPVITVGTALMSRSSERRAAKDHVRIQKEFALLKKTHRELSDKLHEISSSMEELLRRSRPE
jgi:hypothetical protein